MEYYIYWDKFQKKWVLRKKVAGSFKTLHETESLEDLFPNKDIIRFSYGKFESFSVRIIVEKE